MAKKDLTIDERLALLEEAECFFADLSDAGEENYKLGLRKAAALGTVNQCLRLYKEKVLGEDEEWTEEDLKEALDVIINNYYVKKMADIYGMSEKELDFYKGGFGLALGILEGDKEQIDGFREVQSKYDDLIEFKLQNRTLSDLLK